MYSTPLMTDHILCFVLQGQAVRSDMRSWFDALPAPLASPVALTLQCLENGIRRGNRIVDCFVISDQRKQRIKSVCSGGAKQRRRIEVSSCFVQRSFIVEFGNQFGQEAGKIRERIHASPKRYRGSVNSIVFGVRADGLNIERIELKSGGHDKPVLIAFDIEDDTIVTDETRAGIVAL